MFNSNRLLPFPLISAESNCGIMIKKSQTTFNSIYIKSNTPIIKSPQTKTTNNEKIDWFIYKITESQDKESEEEIMAKNKLNRCVKASERMRKVRSEKKRKR